MSILLCKHNRTTCTTFLYIAPWRLFRTSSLPLTHLLRTSIVIGCTGCTGCTDTLRLPFPAHQGRLAQHNSVQPFNILYNLGCTAQSFRIIEVSFVHRAHQPRYTPGNSCTTSAISVQPPPTRLYSILTLFIFNGGQNV